MDFGIVIVLVLFFLPCVFAFLSRRKRLKIISEFKQQETLYLEQIKNITEHAESEEKQKAALQDKYKDVIDAEIEAKKILDETADFESSVKVSCEKLEEEARSMLAKAEQDGIKIVSSAELQAQEIAGAALKAKENAKQYEETVKAMRNAIDGYRDDYIIPNHSVLDDLADEYSYKEAGEKLKLLRKKIREMVKYGNAGECDYVENIRKTYAVHFVVDAFNGKVDSALAKVKHDNFGKLKQEILDAFQLVNHNGKSFRSARINKGYLDARLEELNWAVATMELRRIELEEQKEIRQQMREEEKARRDIEKAMKEAEKEEKMLQKALEKVRKELEGASEEQKAKYEGELAELQSKLAEAEEKGQRAISMAQQTRSGHVYVISNIGSFGENVYKVGMTRRLEPMDRVKELGDASVPFSFDVHAMIHSEDAPTLEKALHRKFDDFSVNKVNSRKEFFSLSLNEIKEATKELNVENVHWTMHAEAQEYRESLAIAQQAEKAA